VDGQNLSRRRALCAVALDVPAEIHVIEQGARRLQDAWSGRSLVRSGQDLLASKNRMNPEERS
jgi:hypothetical protein